MSVARNGAGSLIDTAIPVAGGMLATLGMVVLAGWLTRNAALVQVISTFAPMQYNEALGFLLAGGALLSLSAGRLHLARISAGLLLALALLTLVQYVTGLNLGIDQLLLRPAYITVGTSHPGRMSPNTALGFTAASLALLLNRGAGRRSANTLVATLGAAVAALGILALAGYATGVPAAYGWGEFTRMAVLAALGMFLTGATIMLGAWRPAVGERGHSPHWLPLAAAVGGLTTTLCLWQSLYTAEHEDIARTVEDVADNFKARIEDGLTGRVRPLTRMADRWANRGPTWAADWRNDADHYVSDEGEFLAIRWLGADLAQHEQIAAPGAAGTQGSALLNRIPPNLYSEAASAHAVRLMAMPADGRSWGVVVMAPLQGGLAGGFITGDFLIPDLVERSAPPGFQGAYAAAITVRGQLIYAQGDTVPHARHNWTARRTIALPGSLWNVEIRPEAKTVASMHTGVDEGVLLVGILVSALFAFLIRFAQQAQHRAAEIADSNNVLEREAAKRSVVERALRDSEQRYRDITERSQGFIWIHDFEGRLLTVNPAAAQALGYEPADMLGRSIRDFVTEEMRPHVDGYLEYMRVHPDMSGTVDMLTRAGQKRIWSYSNSRYAEEDRPVYVLANAQDVTQLKETEVELAHARDAALESARLKSEFLANMSHEIRTPLNGVIGMTDLLLTTEQSTEQREYSETIRASADALLTIVNDILDFSKIEAGMLAFETLDFGLRNLVESTVEMFAEPAKRKKLELATLVYSDVPDALRGDPGRLRQVLTNLIGNAVKFTLAGEVTLRVTLEANEDDHAVIRFTITDTGIGIAEEQQERLFQPFIQADGSTARQFGGTGLGLAISRQLVERMGGEIHVESAPGVGSSFWFTGRLEKQPAGTAAAAADVTLEGLRVLIVDDNETNRAVVRHYLAAWKMVPEEAVGGAEAMAVLHDAQQAGTPFDVAVMDLMMPGMTGFELARMIKADPVIAAVRLVLMPSFGKRGHANDAREAGIAAYLVKPVRQTELHDCLLAVVSTDSSAQRPGGKLVTRHSLAEKSRQPKLRILIAEDNLVNQKVLMAQVLKLGYRADLVNNGQEALEALSRYPYALVLMDCQMPRLDGYAAAREIRLREGAERRTPIIAITANALQGEREKCTAAGMDDYLSKPVKQDDLRDMIERWLPRDAGDEVVSSPEFRGDPGIIYKAADITGGMALRDRPTVHELQRENVRQRLDELRAECGVDVLGSLVEMFLADAVGRIEHLHRLIAEHDTGGVHNEAHALKGSCLNFGAQRMGSWCQQLEDRGEAGQPEGMTALLAHVEEEFRVLRVELESFAPAA